MKFPKRAIPLEFLLDSNRINALNRIPSMNIVWTLYEIGVIDLNIPDIAQREASKGSAARFSKAVQIISTTTLDDYRRHKGFKKIKDILFPNGFTPGKEKNQENDGLIVLNKRGRWF